MRFLFFLLTLIPIQLWSQHHCWHQKPDSVLLFVYDNVTKEMISPGESEYKVELGKTKLSARDANKFSRLFENQRNFNDRKALLTHHNIVFEVYKSKKIEYYRISSLTSTVYHHHSYKDKFGQSFVLSINERLEKWIVKSLKTYGFYQLISEDLRFPDDN